MSDEIVELNFLRLLIGGEHAMRAIAALAKKRWDFPFSKVLDESLKIANLPKAEDQINLIVLYYSAKLAMGEPVSEEMKELIIEWYERCRQGKQRGRPETQVKDMCIQWAVIEETARRPADQQKQIIDDVAKKYGVKRSRVYSLRKQWSDLERLAENEQQITYDVYRKGRV